MPWFPGRNSSLLWNFISEFHIHVVYGHGPKPFDFQIFHLQNGHLASILDFSNFSLVLNIKSKLQ